MKSQMNGNFIQLPRALFEGAYADLSLDGKILYSLLMNRHSLSEKNNLTDAHGRIIVYFTNHEVCEKLKCAHDKATRLFRELERNELISRRKQGLGKPDLIYVKDISAGVKSAVKNAEKQEYELSENSTHECVKSAGNNIDNSNTNSSFTGQVFSYEEIEEMIKGQIEYDVIAERGYGKVLDEIVSLIAETYCTAERFVRISKRQVSTQTFRTRISKLTAEHVEYVIASLEKNKGGIQNIRAYLLTALYYSVDTLEADSLYGN